MATFKNLSELSEAIECGAVKMEKHPTEPLALYNYTRGWLREPPADGQDKWENKTIRQCRGIITTLDNPPKFVSRPFEKFFNLEELESVGEELPPEGTPFEITEKIDGSLGILYWDSLGKPCLATRGSFVSEQAVFGTKLLQEKYLEFIPGLNKSFTYLFEIVYPENHIVVNYGNTTALYLLAVIDTESGQELDADKWNPGFPRPKRYDISDWKKIRDEVDPSNKEGFVVKFSTGFRVKMKFKEYFKMHFLRGKLTKRYVIDCLASEKESELENLRNEFKTFAGKDSEEAEIFLNEMISEIKQQYDSIVQKAVGLYIPPEKFGNDMRAWAEYNRSKGIISPILFKLRNFNNLDEALGNSVFKSLVWKVIVVSKDCLIPEQDFACTL